MHLASIRINPVYSQCLTFFTFYSFFFLQYNSSTVLYFRFRLPHRNLFFCPDNNKLGLTMTPHRSHLLPLSLILLFLF